MNCTKGEWIRGTGGSIEGKDGYPIAIVFPDTRLPSGDSIVKREANLELIRTSINACVSVNSDNPMAVAESIKDMYEALKAISVLSPKSMLEDCCYQGIPPKKWVKETAPYYEGYNKLLTQVKNIITEALAKAEGREK